MPPPSIELRVPSALSRMSYFYGQLLTQADLEAEQQYHVRLRRLMQRETFGTGTVAGLRVDSAEPSAARSVIVRAGLAMDPDGRELLLESDVCVVAFEETVPSTEPPVVDFDLVDLGELRRRLNEIGYTELSDDASVRALLRRIGALDEDDDRPLIDRLFDAVAGTAYVGVRYLERGAEPAPALLESACCDDACHPSRRQQGVEIVVSSTAFDSIRDPYADARRYFDDCVERDDGEDEPAHDCVHCLCEYLLGAWRGLPPRDHPCGPSEPPIVPLARVYFSRPSREPRILSIDNCSLRPLAPGVPPIRAMLEALTHCAPAPVIVAPPRIVSSLPAAGASVPFPEDKLLLGATSDQALDRESFRADAWALEILSGDTVRLEGRDTELRLVLDDDDRTVSLEIPQGSGVSLQEGKYIWEINIPDEHGDFPLRAAGSGVALDGELAAGASLPSGDGSPGGVFRLPFAILRRQE